jgi:hypothetical protein
VFTSVENQAFFKELPAPAELSLQIGYDIYWQIRLY